MCGARCHIISWYYIYIYICIILLFGTIEMDMQKHISKIYIEL